MPAKAAGEDTKNPAIVKPMTTNPAVVFLSFCGRRRDADNPEAPASIRLNTLIAFLIFMISSFIAKSDCSFSKAARIARFPQE
jgi:hypothetical protein